MANHRKRRRKCGDAHVRLYGYEMKTAAYQTLTPQARALLIEFRALFDGRENRVFMSIRQIMKRVGIGQRRAEKALEDLIERGWLVSLCKGSFQRKVKHASEFALTNEPLTDRDGATAPKDYMRWEPSEKNTVAATTTGGMHHGYRDSPKSPEKDPLGSRYDYCNPDLSPTSVVTTATQIVLPQGHPEKEEAFKDGNQGKRPKVAA